jgi:hypothetical protein
MRLQPKFGLPFLFITVALAPLLIWVVYQYRERQQRTEAFQRLQRIEEANTSRYPLIRNQRSFRADSSLADLTLNSQHDPHKVLNDCLRAGVRVHKIELSRDCLVDIALAERIARVPGLQRLEIHYGCQVEPAAVGTLLAAAPEIGLEYKWLPELNPGQKLPDHLEVFDVPEDKVAEALATGVAWQPTSLVLHVRHVIDPSKTAFEYLKELDSPPKFPAELRAARQANPAMLIRIGKDAQPTYDWRDPLHETVFQQACGNDLAWADGKPLLEKLVAEEPTAWPALRKLVQDDYRNGRFDAPAVERAKQLNQLVPACPDGYFCIGLSHYFKGEYAQAIEPLQLGVRRLEFNFQYDDYEAGWFVGRAELFMAAAHVGAGHRADGIAELERFLASNWPNRETIVSCTLIAVWIQCTSPQASAKDAAECRKQLDVIKEMQQQRNDGTEFDDQFHLVEAVLACLQRDFPRAEAEYDPIAKAMGAAVKPHFRAEFKRLGECIQRHQPFVTDYVPVVPVWD